MRSLRDKIKGSVKRSFKRRSNECEEERNDVGGMSKEMKKKHKASKKKEAMQYDASLDVFLSLTPLGCLDPGNLSISKKKKAQQENWFWAE